MSTVSDALQNLWTIVADNELKIISQLATSISSAIQANPSPETW